MKKLKLEKRVLKSFLILICLLSCLILFSPLKAKAVSAGQISAIPASPRADNPRTTSIFVYTAKAGDTIKDEVLLSSIAPDATMVNLYATDSIASNTGAPGCEQEVDEKNEVGQWTQIENGHPTIPGESSIKAPFKIVIPSNVKGGEYNGCMVLQTIQNQNEGSPGINLKTRLALRIVIFIPGDVHKDFQITKVSPIVENSRYLIRPEFENKSNVSLDTDINVNMKAFGLFDYFSDNLKTSYLKNSKAFSLFDFKYSEWGGIYKVDVSAKYDGNPANELNGPNPEYITRNSTIWLLIWPDFLHTAILCTLFATVLIIIDRYFYKKIQREKLRSE